MRSEKARQKKKNENERKVFLLYLSDRGEAKFSPAFEDGVLCLYSHFIKEIKFMTQL